jgi:hypothetical protein
MDIAVDCNIPPETRTERCCLGGRLSEIAMPTISMFYGILI